MVVAAFAAILWALTLPRVGDRDDGGREGDLFERAGVTPISLSTRVPAFRVREFPGGGYRTLEDYAGKLVVLNFWATWCGPCTAEMPTLEALWLRYRARGLVVLAVSVDRGAPSSVIEPYTKRLRLTFPVLLDPDMSVASGWRVTSLPATYIVRPGGAIAGVAVGSREWDSAPMRALLETLLPAARTSAPPASRRAFVNDPGERQWRWRARCSDWSASMLSAERLKMSGTGHPSSPA